MYPTWDLIGLSLYHCFLFSSLLVFTLLAVDRNRIPRKLPVFCFTIAILAPLLFPSLVLISAWPSGTSSTCAATKTLLHGVAGLIGGAIAGGFLSRLLTVDQNSINQRVAVIASMSLIGTMLGWHAALCTAVLFGISRAIRRYGLQSQAAFQSGSFGGELLVVTLLHHLLWRMEWTALTVF